MSPPVRRGQQDMQTTTTGRYAPVNGLQLYYEEHGSGHPLVLLHGGLHTIDLSFGALIPLLAASHRVIAVELQGHGRTADIDRAPTYPNLADDVAALLDHLGIERADVFGFSLGGLVAIELGLQHPTRVDRLVLAAVSYRPEGGHDLSDPTSVRMPTPTEFAEMEQEYRRVAPHPDHWGAFTAKLNGIVHTAPGWSADDMRRLAAPVLLVIGDTDFVRIEHAAEMLELIPDAELAVLPRTRHTELTLRTDVLSPLVERFLTTRAFEGS
jgi:pimeloyl-ACP methyl ester carboxylesterase